MMRIGPVCRTRGRDLVRPDLNRDLLSSFRTLGVIFEEPRCKVGSNGHDVASFLSEILLTKIMLDDVIDVCLSFIVFLLDPISYHFSLSFSIISYHFLSFPIIIYHYQSFSIILLSFIIHFPLIFCLIIQSH